MYNLVTMSEQSYKLFWENAKTFLAKRITDENVTKIYLEEGELVGIEDKKIFIKFDTELAKNLFDGFYNQDLCLAIKETMQSDFEPFLFTTKEWEQEQEKKSGKQNYYLSSSMINKDLSFSSFVVGDCNNAAYSAGQQVINNLKNPLWNPIFIYGDSGLGKTHILSAVYNEIKKKHSSAAVLFMNGSDFASAIYEALNHGSVYLEKLKKKVSALYDVFIIDDVQFLANKQKTSEIFYHLFNSFVQKKKQIILASDVIPDSLSGFNQRVISRFKQGLSIAVESPGTETAVKIIKKKIEYQKRTSGERDLNFDFTTEAISFIASRFNENVRSLEGAINRMVFWSIMNDQNLITLPLVVDALKDKVSFSHQTISPKNIIKFVSEETGVSAVQIKGSSRIKAIVSARHLAMSLIKEVLDLPFAQIAHNFNGKNHSTVMAAVKKTERMKKQDIRFKSYFTLLVNKIKN